MPLYRLRIPQLHTKSYRSACDHSKICEITIEHVQMVQKIKQNQLKLQRQAQQFVKELEDTLREFENKGDVKQLSNKIKESISEFQKSID